MTDAERAISEQRTLEGRVTALEVKVDFLQDLAADVFCDVRALLRCAGLKSIRQQIHHPAQINELVELGQALDKITPPPEAPEIGESISVL